MKLFKAITVLAIIIFTGLLLGGCKDETALNANGVPGKLIIGMYGGDNPGQIKAAMLPMQQYLEKKLGIKVEFFFTTDYTAVIQAMRSKKVHMADLTPFAYIIASQKPGLLPIATLGAHGKPAIYHSIIFTARQSAVKTMDDVKRHSKNLTLCFADPASTSGHLIPRAYLTGIGLNPDSAFKQTMFAGSHAASILSVRSGKVDVGCSTSELALDKLIREGVVKREDFNIIWTSPPIINNAITVRSDLNKDLIKKIQAAYLDVARDDYPALSAFTKLFYPNPKEIYYITVQDSQYDALRKIAGNIKDLKLK